MRLPLLLTLTASAGLVSAKKCKARSSKLSSALPSSSLGSISSVGSASLEPSHISEPSSSIQSVTVSSSGSVASSAASSTPASSAPSPVSSGPSSASSGPSSISSAPSSSVASSSSVAPSSSAAPPTPKQICQVRGTSEVRPIQESDWISDNSFNGCKTLCAAQEGCKGFSFQIMTGGFCMLYTEDLYLHVVEATTGPTWFFDADCPAPEVQGPTLYKYDPPAAPAEEVPKSPGPVFQVPSYTPPSPTKVSSDSPPYVHSGAQSKPTDDNKFIATYTYEQYELPTVIAEGYPPVTTGIPMEKGDPLPCMATAGPEHPFSLVNEAYLPLVSRTGSVGPLLQPTEAPAPDDPILNPMGMVLPPFFFKEVAGSPDLYDIVYEQTGEFVALNGNGEVILVPSSTGPSFSGDHITSVFSFDCRGTLYVTVDGAKYEWSTKGQSCSIVPSGSPKNNMKLLPVNIPKVPPTEQNIKRARELMEIHNGSKNKRVNTDHREPQCPSQPPGLVSGTKPGYELNQGNFCEDLNEWWGLSPFDFEGACVIQSLCFDQCSGWSFDGCVAAFSAAMYLSCLNEFDSWWDALEAAACAVQATVFVGFAATETGEKLYNKANEAMCRCFCSNPPDTCVFLDDKGDFSDKFYCANLKGSDSDNCGNCGRLCGANSACHGGVCGCPKDQCGTTCLDFRNNPNHCGKCNNPCNPAYCIDGSCYEPKPGECTPEQAVTNGKFETFSPTWKNWTLAPFPGTTLGAGMNMEPIAANYRFAEDKDPIMSIGFKANNIPAAGYHVLLSQKNVKMCSKFKYELTFALGFANQLNGEGVVSNADCKVRWLTGPPSAHNIDDGFQSSLSYSIGSSNPTFKTFGPWTLNVKPGQKGVTEAHGDLFIELSAVISCYQPPGGYGLFILTDVQMNPVGLAPTKRAETFGNETLGFPLIESREIAPTDMDALLKPFHGEFADVGLSRSSTKKR